MNTLCMRLKNISSFICKEQCKVIWIRNICNSENNGYYIHISVVLEMKPQLVVKMSNVKPKAGRG